MLKHLITFTNTTNSKLPIKNILALTYKLLKQKIFPSKWTSYKKKVPFSTFSFESIHLYIYSTFYHRLFLTVWKKVFFSFLLLSSYGLLCALHNPIYFILIFFRYSCIFLLFFVFILLFWSVGYFWEFEDENKNKKSWNKGKLHPRT